MIDSVFIEFLFSLLCSISLFGITIIFFWLDNFSKQQSKSKIRMAIVTLPAGKLQTAPYVPDESVEACSKPAPFDLLAKAKGKKIVIFGLPGAFTPTCQETHLPGFITKVEMKPYLKLSFNPIINQKRKWLREHRWIPPFFPIAKKQDHWEQ